MTIVKIQTCFEKEAYSKFTKIAKDEGRNISKMLDIICDSYLKQIEEPIQN